SHDPLFTTAGLAQDSFAIYAGGGTTVYRGNKVDPAPAPSGPLYEGRQSITAVDIDGTQLYFAEVNSVKRIPVAGGPASEIVSTAAPIIMISHDSEAVYWVETSSDLWPDGHA